VKVEIREKSSIKAVGVESLDNLREIDYLFSTRGGISEMERLDFDRKGFNDTEVRRSYKAAADFFGVDAKDIFVTNQVHGNKVTSLIEKPKKDEMFGVVETDGVVTDLSKIVLVVLTADCVPVLMADVKAGVVGVVHAGWRGTVADISAVAVKTMVDSFGSKHEDIVVVFGPAIGPCCYEVGQEVVTTINEKFPSPRKYLLETEGENYRLDLFELNRFILKEAGVPDGNIFSSGLCTHCNPELFYSYRREGAETGRMMSAIMLR